jgi:hypothetical protein
MFGFFVRRGAFDPSPDQGEGGVGVACLLPVNTWTKWLHQGNSGGTATMDRRQNPHLTSPWSRGGIAVLSVATSLTRIYAT